MMEPTIWMQLGITEERYNVVVKEVESVIKTKETIGNMMLMVQSSAKMNESEKFYAAFLLSKEETMRRLMNALPSPFRGAIKKVMED